MANEEDLFLQEMGDVKPLKQDNQADVGRARLDQTSAEERRRQATTEKAVDRNYLATDYVTQLDPHYTLDFKRPGIQNGVFRKLKQGKYGIESKLDLHRMTVERARRDVFEYLLECRENDIRSVLLVHGKGAHRKPEDEERSAKLKSFLNHWLRQMPEVQAFHSALPAHGGVGAVYVLLKKSERKKEENRQQFR